jgi:hypothetical protein
MTHKDQPQPHNTAVSPLSLPPIERQFGNTTYIITARFNPNAREGLLGKLRRLIQNDAD